jgi:hypothetical protein
MQHQCANRYKVLFKIVLVTLILVTLLLGVPISGSMVADELFHALGCSSPGFSEMSPCLVAGMDISWRFEIYYIPMIGVFFSPLAFVMGFYNCIILCVVLLLVFKALAQRQDE